MSDLPTYFMHDQPMTCPQCGRRTEFDENPDGSQSHICACGFRFLAVEDDRVTDVAQALRNYMRLVKYLKRTTNPEEWATHGDWDKLERGAIAALDEAGEESQV